MTATNHALTGALIGLTVHNPWVAIPVAVASHLVCDALPHFDSTDPKWIAHKGFRMYLALDLCLCVLLVAVLFASGNPNWLLASVCAFAATVPDAIWIRQLIVVTSGKAFHANPLERFLLWIQWSAKPSGAVVEAAWLLGTLMLLLPMLHDM